jgi:hypothetical protein
MRKAAALRLKRNDRILYGDARNLRDIRHTYVGLVRHVTPKGGVLVIRMDESETRMIAEEWLPYSHIIEKLRS